MIDEVDQASNNQVFLGFLAQLRGYYINRDVSPTFRTDVIVDYKSEQFVIEMKIWHGEEYNARGEQQLTEYLDYYHIDTGYLLSFCFNKRKNVGVNVNELKIGKKTIIVIYAQIFKVTRIYVKKGLQQPLFL